MVRRTSVVLAEAVLLAVLAAVAAIALTTTGTVAAPATELALATLGVGAGVLPGASRGLRSLERAGAI